MTIGRWLAAALAALFTACASQHAAPPPETRAALAPKGPLRVAFLVVPLYAAKDAGSGQYSGLAPDIAGELAVRVGVPLELKAYSSVPTMIGAAKNDEYDLVLTGALPERAKLLDFSVAIVDVQQGLLARPGLAARTVDDIDQPGIRVAVLEKGGADLALTQKLKHAEIVRASANELFALLASGKVDVMAGTKATLTERSQAMPGSRLLEGSILVEPIALGVPKGRNPSAVAYLNVVVADLKASGKAQRSIENARLVGVVVAP